jgi:hypothetical protein
MSSVKLLVLIAIDFAFTWTCARPAQKGSGTMNFFQIFPQEVCGPLLL